jgi:hypothetical protein
MKLSDNEVLNLWSEYSGELRFRIVPLGLWCVGAAQLKDYRWES